MQSCLYRQQVADTDGTGGKEAESNRMPGPSKKPKLKGPQTMLKYLANRGASTITL